VSAVPALPASLYDGQDRPSHGHRTGQSGDCALMRAQKQRSTAPVARVVDRLGRHNWAGVSACRYTSEATKGKCLPWLANHALITACWRASHPRFNHFRVQSRQPSRKRLRTRLKIFTCTAARFHRRCPVPRNLVLLRTHRAGDGVGAEQHLHRLLSTLDRQRLAQDMRLKYCLWLVR
jgi:hypothetical protein